MDANLVLMPYAASDFRHPNVFVWQHNAKVTQAGLRQLIGEVPYEIFAGTVWADEIIDHLSWMTIHKQAEAAYYLAARGERDLTKLIDVALNGVEVSPEANTP